MCVTCGCGAKPATIEKLGQHGHSHGQAGTLKTEPISVKNLKKNSDSGKLEKADR